MSRAIILSNGELALALDEFARVRDIYYPHVGLEDHARGHYMHRIGVFADGRMSWLGEDTAWQITVGCADDALESRIVAVHPDLKVELAFTDAVYNEQPIFLRRVTVINRSAEARGIKIFFAHQFEIGKTHGGETAYFDPSQHAIIHYKGRRVFLMSGTLDNVPFEDYATGRYGFQGKEGTHRDAEDGVLSKNPIEHGQVDSVIGMGAGFAPEQARVARYWMAAAQTLTDAVTEHAYVVEKTHDHLVGSVRDYWRAWLSSYDWHFSGLSNEQVALFKRSLLYMRAHVDKEGGILASLDSDMLRYADDTYGYVWPRDAAFAALSLDSAGDENAARRFFEFARDVVGSGGYFLHKYLPDRSLGSSWHPWVKDGKPQLPIQEDETALVLYALCEHYRFSRDLEFIESVFEPLIERTADFLVSYRDEATKLPRASYDLWEEQHGTFTFTAAAVHGALEGASELSGILGKRAHSERYGKAATEVRDAILARLWDDGAGIFVKSLREDGSLDKTVDMSGVYGVWRFGVLPANDARLARAFEGSVRALSRGVKTGGIARYEGDAYYRQEGEKDAEVTGNPWIITTLWYAEYLTAIARTEEDFVRVRTVLDWVVRHAEPSGVLPEQVDAKTGAPLSATPLMWSHAAFVSAIVAYLNRLEQLGLCTDCNPVP
jgi:GH15 family glucan-1,4-alpha-glucosidase